jgi:hypothetical protein
MSKDAFDQWHEWATKLPRSDLSIPADLHGAVTALAPEDRLDREKWPEYSSISQTILSNTLGKLSRTSGKLPLRDGTAFYSGYC